MSKGEEVSMWNGSSDGKPEEPVIYYEVPRLSKEPTPISPDTGQYTGGVVVRAEEALIVVLVLILWVGAIALFFNRWGKIRMLEPYQPKFHQEHRPSCPMAEISTVRHDQQHRTSFSKFNVNWDAERGAGGLPCRSLLRPRQNSVFVGSTLTVKMNPPRKTKSAMDIQSLLSAETSPGVTSRSMLPMLSVERRPSSRPASTGYLSPRRPSDLLSERRASGELLAPPPLSARRPSCSGDFLPGVGRRPSCSGDFLPPLGRRPSCSGDCLTIPPFVAPTRERRPSFNNVIAQVTAERRPSSSMLRITNV